MKKRLKLFSALSLFLAVSSLPVYSLAANGNDEVRKVRTINKSYPVTSEDKLEIDNQFGNVTVSTWDKDEITVDVEIAAKANSERLAQDIMNELEVKDWQSGHIISFKTKVGEIHNNGDKRKGSDEDRAFYIDYVIHMPKRNRLTIENSFGKIMVPDLNGEVNLTSKFGSLSAGKLTTVDNIDVEFGKVNISELNDGKIVFKFNKESNIGKVNGNVKITSEFSHNVQFNVGDNIQDLSVFESYSGVRVVVAKTLSAEVDVHTSFGKFYNESDFAIRERREDTDGDYGPHFDKDYSGKAGDGKARIKIKSSFGNVRLSHTGGAVSKSKDKNKDKKEKEEKDDDKDEDDNDDKTT